MMRWPTPSPLDPRQYRPSRCLLYDLPDELLILLLQYLDFRSLNNVAHASMRLRRVVCCVLRYYLLPRVRVATVMDQEGRGRWTCRYRFYGLDHDEREPRAVFAPADDDPMRCHKRYRCDGSTAAPTLRQLVVVCDDGDVSLMQKERALPVKLGGVHRVEAVQKHQAVLSYVVHADSGGTDQHAARASADPRRSSKHSDTNASSSSSRAAQCHITPLELAIHVPLLAGQQHCRRRRRHPLWDRWSSVLGMQ